MKKDKKETGFTLIEITVAIFVLAILAFGVCQLFISMINGISYYRERTTISSLADQYLEVARNLPYSQIGTLEGSPHGSLPDLPNALIIDFGGVDYKVYYVVNLIDDPADGVIGGQPNDFAANDYKQIKLYIQNVTSGATNSFLTNVSPKGLEGLESGGALSIKVFDAVGQPVPGVTIHITNTDLNPDLNLTRLSDANGTWIEVGLPDVANSYHIEVAKNGYSQDSTYPITEQNPNPTKPDATILNGQVTFITFAIDKLSDLFFTTLNQTCQPLSGVQMSITGAKLIGTPNVFKFDNNYTSSSGGQIALNNIEWDNYTTASLDTNYMVFGSSPAQAANVLPDTSQSFDLILGPKTANSLLITVKDASTGNTIEGAEVTLQRTGYSSTKLTAGSTWVQQDWSGGSGQENFINEDEYFEDDGNINTHGIPSGLRLMKNGDFYVPFGWLISSTFDTGTEETSYTNLVWEPASQGPSTNVSFQIASNNDNQTWNFVGPDGTINTYYTTPGIAINSVHNNNRYIRYKVFLSTSDDSVTPVITSVSVNYVSGCFTPGQAMFSGIGPGNVDEGTDYEAIVSMSGYQTQTVTDVDVDGYTALQVLLPH